MITGLKTLLRDLIARLDLRDCLFWCGFASLWWGCREMYSPSAPIACGLLLIALALFAGTGKAKD